jgi:multifunctional cyclase/dehydratase/O-methyltransferase
MDEQRNGFLAALPGGLPPAQRVLALFTAKWLIGAIRPLLQLNVPDLLADGPRTVEDLAVATGAVADPLYRVLRGAAAAGVFEERPDGTFALTPYSESLRSGPEGFRDMFLFASDPMMWRPYEDGVHSVRTDTATFDRVFGMSFFDYVKANPASGAVFDRAMNQNRYPMTEEIIGGYDFGRFRRIADVGGGQGQFLADVLRRHPGLTGLLCDQEHVVADAKSIFEAAGVGSRATIVPTDFFTAIPSGCDAYLIKHALHNWDDERAETILRRVREAIGTDADARLLVIDMVLTGPGGWDIGKLIDLEMLYILGGRERSVAEWSRLLHRAGFTLANDPRPGNLAILECAPA